MNVLSEVFSLECRRKFSFLERSGFVLTDAVRDAYGSRLTYRNPFVAIRINLELAQIFIDCYILQCGTIPARPAHVNPHDDCLVFDFNDLLFIKSGKVIEQDARRMYNKEYLLEKINEFSEAVRIYGADFLSGDFSVMPKIKERIIRRIKDAGMGTIG
jgi:hypothetical protein